MGSGSLHSLADLGRQRSSPIRGSCADHDAKSPLRRCDFIHPKILLGLDFLDLRRFFDLPAPATAERTGENYYFEKGAAKHEGGDGFADVWKRGFFNVAVMRAVSHNPEALHPARTCVAVTQDAARQFADSLLPLGCSQLAAAWTGMWVNERPFAAASKLAVPTAAASCTQSTARNALPQSRTLIDSRLGARGPSDGLWRDATATRRSIHPSSSSQPQGRSRRPEAGQPNLPKRAPRTDLRPCGVVKMRMRVSSRLSGCKARR
jgi:hypothetical protein